MIKPFILVLIILTFPRFSEATILACSDRIENVKKAKEKEGLGELGESICNKSKKGKKARYKKESSWQCKTVEDYPCVHNKKLKMIKCDREWECY